MGALLPEAVIAQLRLASSRELLDGMFAEPILFAAHYTTAASSLTWPERIEEARNQVQTRYSRHDEMLGLMEKLRDQISPLARLIAEGIEMRCAISPESY